MTNRARGERQAFGLYSAPHSAVTERHLPKPNGSSQRRGYTKQHFLPVAYLKEFALDQGSSGRKWSKIWVCDGKATRLARVERECFQNHFYSKERASAVERMFGETESFYGKCIEKIKAGKGSTIQDYFGLIIFMFDLHLRNAAYVNQTGKENIDAYYVRVQGLRRTILLGREEGEPSDDEVVEHLKKYWRLRVMRAPDGQGLLTSGNPSIWMALDRPPSKLHMMVLPLTPIHVAVAFDRRYVGTVGEPMTVRDAGVMNIMQCWGAARFVYSPSQFTEELQGSVAYHFQRRIPGRCISNEEGWKTSLVRIDDATRFSFVRDAKPLL